MQIRVRTLYDAASDETLVDTKEVICDNPNASTCRIIIILIISNELKFIES